MNNLAVCIFGNGKTNVTQIKNKCTEAFVDYNITFFYIPDNNEFRSLWLTANEKRQYEIFNGRDFNLCMGIRDTDTSIINDIKIKSSINTNILYFSIGRFNNKYYCTEIEPTGFYATSHIFDRVAEFIFTKITQINLRVDNVSARFYFHLKYLKIKTECVNYENSYLFKRTA